MCDFCRYSGELYLLQDARLAVNTSFYFLDTSIKLKIIHKEFDDHPVDGEPGSVEQSFQHEGILKDSKEEDEMRDEIEDAANLAFAMQQGHNSRNIELIISCKD